MPRQWTRTQYRALKVVKYQRDIVQQISLSPRHTTPCNTPDDIKAVYNFREYGYIAFSVVSYPGFHAGARQTEAPARYDGSLIVFCGLLASTNIIIELVVIEITLVRSPSLTYSAVRRVAWEAFQAGEMGGDTH